MFRFRKNNNMFKGYGILIFKRFLAGLVFCMVATLVTWRVYHHLNKAGFNLKKEQRGQIACAISILLSASIKLGYFYQYIMSL